MLDVLGLDNDEETAYRRLVELPSGSAEELAPLLGDDLVEAASVLARLEAKGLVARSTSGRGRFVASPPAVALGALIMNRQEDIRRAHLELNALSELYRGTAGDRSVNDVVDVVRGAQAVRQRFAQLQQTAKREIQILVRSQFAVVTPEENDDETVAAGRGVHYRAVVERDIFDRPGAYQGAADSIRNGVEVRVTPTVPIRLLIADRELALVPLEAADGDPSGGALLIHASGLLDALQAMFDFIWETASRLTLAEEGGVHEIDGDQLDPLDSEVLGLLFVGLTDQAIGSQLSISLRTVQRRVRMLMERARVETRLQLGVQAARRGWL